MITVVLAAVPWHWWFAPIWLGADVIALVVLAVGYYRKVLVPEHRLRMARRQELQRRTQRGAVGSGDAEHAEREAWRLGA